MTIPEVPIRDALTGVQCPASSRDHRVSARSDPREPLGVDAHRDVVALGQEFVATGDEPAVTAARQSLLQHRVAHANGIAWANCHAEGHVPRHTPPNAPRVKLTMSSRCIRRLYIETVKPNEAITSSNPAARAAATSKWMG